MGFFDFFTYWMHKPVQVPGTILEKKTSFVSSDDLSENWRNGFSIVQSPVSVRDPYVFKSASVTNFSVHSRLGRYLYAMLLLLEKEDTFHMDYDVDTVLRLAGSKSYTDEDFSRLHPLHSSTIDSNFYKKKLFLDSNESIYDLLMRYVLILCSKKYENESFYRVKLRFNILLRTLGCGTTACFNGQDVQHLLHVWYHQLLDVGMVNFSGEIPFNFYHLEFLSYQDFNKHGLTSTIVVRGQVSELDPHKSLATLLSHEGGVDSNPLYKIQVSK